MKRAPKRVGFVGLGKLGLPVALAIESKGHSVIGYDVDPRVKEYVEARQIPYREVGVPELLKDTKIQVGTLASVIKNADIVFVPIQTPHDARFEGITRLPLERADFDYTFLRNGVREIALCAQKQTKHITLVIISTVLPGTIGREIKPLLNGYTHLVYEPIFIAMGTTVRDFLHPEFVLVGVDEHAPAQKLKEFYATIHDRPIVETTIESAELIKVAYNTFIGMKIVFANTMMEICHKTGANVDQVTKALSLATGRLLSPRYLMGGMGDGGGCHPRDNIAMSYLAKRLSLSHNLFDDLMMAREHQTEWLADLIAAEHAQQGLPVVILGKSFKSETNLVIGSPAILLGNLLKERGLAFTHYDPHVEDDVEPRERAIYFIATRHELFNSYRFPSGSVVLDPFRFIKCRAGVTVIRIGEH